MIAFYTTYCRSSRAHLFEAFAVAIIVMATGCGEDLGEPIGEAQCGPSTGLVERVVDGDTVVLSSGERVRYLLVDTPELKGEECFAQQALARNEQLVLGQSIRLEYDVDCEDRFDRLLAYVYIENTMVNRVLIAQGYAEVLQIAPNGDAFVEEFEMLESKAQDTSAGKWGACL